MTIYTSVHFNISGFLEPSHQDDLNVYSQMLYRFSVDSYLKGIISLNSLLIKTLMWQDITIIKHISKLLSLTNKFELASSMYSNFITPTSTMKTQYVEEDLVDKAISIIKSVYSNIPINSFYFPLGTYNHNYLHGLIKNGIKYLIVDWQLIQRSLETQKKAIHAFQPFKLKNQDVIVLPSCNFNTVRHFMPRGYNSYIARGEIEDFKKEIAEHKKRFDEEHLDYFCILSLDLNDIRFPQFDSNFQVINFLRDASSILKDDVVAFLPSEIEEQCETMHEIELLDTIQPYEINSRLSNIKNNYALCTEFCKRLIQTREALYRAIAVLKEANKDKIERFLKQAYLTAHHNYCLATYGIPISGIDIKKVFTLKGALVQLEQISKIIENENASDNDVKSECTSIEHVGRFAVSNDKYIALFNATGGHLSSFIDIEKGNVVTYTLIPELSISPSTNEPISGLMYDVVSRHYWGQFNLFNETYYPIISKHENMAKIGFSCYPLGNILLSKDFMIDHLTRKITIAYNVTNTGHREDRFTIYSLSRINLGAFQYELLTRDDLSYNVISNSNNNKIILKNNPLSSSIEIQVPKEVMINVAKGFLGFDLGLQFNVKQLDKGEKITYPIEIYY